MGAGLLHGSLSTEVKATIDRRPHGMAGNILNIGRELSRRGCRPAPRLETSRRSCERFGSPTHERPAGPARAGAGVGGARRSEEVHDLVAVDELQFGERHDAVLERGLEGEVEASERLDRIGASSRPAQLMQKSQNLCKSGRTSKRP
jgi:hypothetical protein